MEFSDFRQRQLDVFAFERVSRSGKVPEVQRVPGEFLDLDGVVAVVVGVDEDGRKLLLKKISKVLFFFQVKTHKLCKQSYINIVYNIYFWDQFFCPIARNEIVEYSYLESIFPSEERVELSGPNKNILIVKHELHENV